MILHAQQIYRSSSLSCCLSVCSLSVFIYHSVDLFACLSLLIHCIIHILPICRWNSLSPVARSGWCDPDDSLLRGASEERQVQHLRRDLESALRLVVGPLGDDSVSRRNNGVMLFRERFLLLLFFLQVTTVTWLKVDLASGNVSG